MKESCLRLLRSSIALSTIVFITGCVTTIDPVSSTNTIAEEMRNLSPELGKPAFLGITANLRLKSFNSDPNLSIYLLHANSGKSIKIRADANPSLITKDGFIPLLFIVPHGIYTLEKVELYIPGGEIDGAKFKGSTTTVPLDKSFSKFQIGEGEFLHILKIGATTTQQLKNYGDNLHSSMESYHSFERPAPETWERFKPFLQGKTSFFLRTTPMERVERLALDWTKNPPREKSTTNGVGFERPFSGRRNESVMKVLNGLTLKASECQNKHVTRKKGRLNYSYVIAPDGSVPLTKVTENQLASVAFAECVSAAIKTLKFGPSPDDDYAIWNGSLEL